MDVVGKVGILAVGKGLRGKWVLHYAVVDLFHAGLIVEALAVLFDLIWSGFTGRQGLDTHLVLSSGIVVTTPAGRKPGFMSRYLPTLIIEVRAYY